MHWHENNSDEKGICAIMPRQAADSLAGARVFPCHLAPGVRY